jgi:hypothetical protein
LRIHNAIYYLPAKFTRSKVSELQKVRKYGLLVAVGAAALFVPMILFAVIGNDDRNSIK